MMCRYCLEEDAQKGRFGKPSYWRWREFNSLLLAESVFAISQLRSADQIWADDAMVGIMV